MVSSSLAQGSFVPVSILFSSKEITQFHTSLSRYWPLDVASTTYWKFVTHQIIAGNHFAIASLFPSKKMLYKSEWMPTTVFLDYVSAGLPLIFRGKYRTIRDSFKILLGYHNIVPTSLLFDDIGFKLLPCFSRRRCWISFQNQVVDIAIFGWCWRWLRFSCFCLVREFFFRWDWAICPLLEVWSEACHFEHKSTKIVVDLDSSYSFFLTTRQMTWA